MTAYSIEMIGTEVGRILARKLLTVFLARVQCRWCALIRRNKKVLYSFVFSYIFVLCISAISGELNLIVPLYITVVVYLIAYMVGMIYVRIMSHEYDKYLKTFIKEGWEFDGIWGGFRREGKRRNFWIEGKTVLHWQNCINDQKAMAMYKSELDRKAKIAAKYETVLRVGSDGPTPVVFKEYMKKKDIIFRI